MIIEINPLDLLFLWNIRFLSWIYANRLIPFLMVLIAIPSTILILNDSMPPITSILVWLVSLPIIIPSISLTNMTIFRLLLRSFEYLYLTFINWFTCFLALLLIEIGRSNLWIIGSVTAQLALSYDSRPAPILVGETAYKTRPIIGSLMLLIIPIYVIFMILFKSSFLSDVEVDVASRTIKLSNLLISFLITMITFGIKNTIRSVKGDNIVIREYIQYKTLSQEEMMRYY